MPKGDAFPFYTIHRSLIAASSQPHRNLITTVWSGLVVRGSHHHYAPDRILLASARLPQAHLPSIRAIQVLATTACCVTESVPPHQVTAHRATT